MSSSDTHERRIDLLEGRVTDDHLESIKNDGATAADADAGDSGDGVNVVEALSSYDDETLDDVDEIETEIEALQEKIDVLGTALPAGRREEVRDTIEALEAAADVHSPLRTNSAEALAERIEVRRR